jgi:hypothetical protein
MSTLSAGPLGRRYGVSARCIGQWTDAGLPVAGHKDDQRGTKVYDPAACDRWVAEHRPGNLPETAAPTDDNDPTPGESPATIPPPQPPAVASVAPAASDSAVFVIPPPPDATASMADWEKYDKQVRSLKVAAAVAQTLGNLLDSGKVQAGVARLHARVRQRLEAVPARSAPQILAELKADQSQWAVVATILENEIRQVCEELHADPLGDESTPALRLA